MKASLMTHLIAGYPRSGADREIAHALVRGGASFLEVQFPYSDPTADGPAIQEACQVALDGGFRVAAGFDLVSKLATEIEAPIFIMSYAGLVFARGVERFVGEAAAAGAHGVIVPDLPLESDEGLYALSAKAGVSAVPVSVATASPDRLEALSRLQPDYLYVALRAGTTGSSTTLSEESIRFLEAARGAAGHVMGGFGITTRRDVEALMPHCDTAVVGSAIVRAVGRADRLATAGEGGGAAVADRPAAAAEDLVRELVFG
jgi:tryptophan synthase alpha chain